MLTIIIEDENDNNPKFRRPFYRRSITENSKNGVTIINVVADDADKNRTIKYALEGRHCYYSCSNKCTRRSGGQGSALFSSRWSCFKGRNRGDGQELILKLGVLKEPDVPHPQVRGKLSYRRGPPRHTIPDGAQLVLSRGRDPQEYKVGSANKALMKSAHQLSPTFAKSHRGLSPSNRTHVLAATHPLSWLGQLRLTEARAKSEPQTPKENTVANLTWQTSAPGMFQLSLAITGTSAFGPERCSLPFLCSMCLPFSPPFTENLFVYNNRCNIIGQGESPFAFATSPVPPPNSASGVLEERVSGSTTSAANLLPWDEPGAVSLDGPSVVPRGGIEAVPQGGFGGEPLGVLREMGGGNDFWEGVPSRPRDILNLIYLDEETGEVVVANKIDHEVFPWLNFTVQATDSGIPPRSSFVDNFIQVLDENDNNPYFVGDVNNITVREDAPLEFTKGRRLLHLIEEDQAGGFCPAIR
uniref:(California timema) hypothetical protein n=1 Tax=Timema californicum TaxID=61474 RepID=A0A7R9P702_TIMCA|nr:unnamed protein product [Timema californicum]